jgi:O-antigen ligase
LVVAGLVCLWHFGIKGKRLYLIVVSGVAVVVLLMTNGNVMLQRFSSLWDDELDTHQEKVAYESYEQRSFLMQRAVEGIEHYPILGIGTQNFETYSTVWREVHMTYLQIAVEGGIPSMILYLLFFWRGFKNLRYLLKRKDLESDLHLFTGALHASLIGFAIGALFSPEAYQFFPYFAVAYTSALLAIVKERDARERRTQHERQPRRSDALRPLPVPVHT